MTGINEVAKEIHENAVAHGWWDEERGFPLSRKCNRENMPCLSALG